jgi:hypothetical protein
LRRPLEPGLHATVAMVDQPRRRLPASEGHEQCIAGKLGPEMVGHRWPAELTLGLPGLAKPATAIATACKAYFIGLCSSSR